MSLSNQSPVRQRVHTLDLNFQGMPGVIASYLIPHDHGVVLIESGPGSTTGALEKRLQSEGFSVKDVSDVLLTHIHLDHAGAAGWLARQGARIHVHHVGAPHMVDPEKLLASAGRIYGDLMDELWGEFLPVPEDRLSVLHGEDVVEVGSLRIRAIDTPGHANHHFAYLFENILFTGDIGGVRLSGTRHLRLPMPPPEFHLEKWRASLARLAQEIDGVDYIAPTHFGVFEDPGWHLASLAKAIDEVEEWMETVMPQEPPIDSLNDRFLDWTRRRSLEEGISEEIMQAYEAANPSWMSPMGVQRYWRKHRAGEKPAS